MPSHEAFKEFLQRSYTTYTSIVILIFLAFCDVGVGRGGRGGGRSSSRSRSRNYRYRGGSGIGAGTTGFNSGSTYYETYEDTIWPLLTLVMFVLSVFGCCGYYRYRAYREEKAAEESLQLLENEG